MSEVSGSLRDAFISAALSAGGDYGGEFLHVNTLVCHSRVSLWSPVS
ncbi:hypothetical protein [Rubritalea tangerina]